MDICLEKPRPDVNSARTGMQLSPMEARAEP